MRSLSQEEELEFLDLNRRYDHCAGDDREFHKYLSREDVRDYWKVERIGDGTPLCKAQGDYATCAVLSVGRSKDEFLRKSLACVMPLGLLLKDCNEYEDLGMYGGAVFEHVFCSGHKMCWAGLDESQAFTSVVMTDWHWKYQATPVMEFEDVPVCYREAGWRSGDKVRALYKRMAMGSTNSVFLLMMIHLKLSSEAIKRCPLVSSFKCLNVGAVRHRGRRVDSREGVYYVHVDDVVSGHDYQKLADCAIEVIASAFSAAWFVVKCELRGTLQKFVGYVHSNRGRQLGLSNFRAGDLSRALGLLCRQKRVAFGALRTASSIFVWAALTWRSAFSICHELFRFISSTPDGTEWVILPKRVADELRWMSALVVMLLMKLNRRTIPVLFSQDAAGGSKHLGEKPLVTYAMCVGFPSAQDVELIAGRALVEGRSYRKAARDQALGTLYADTVPWTSVPLSVFSAETPWVNVLTRRFKFPMHINEGELRPSVLWLQLAGGTCDIQGLLMGDQSDNSVTSGGMKHGRSPSPNLNRQLRHRCVLEGLTDCREVTAWTSTAFQPGDIDTRTENHDTRIVFTLLA